jgi:hypothetical protein
MKNLILKAKTQRGQTLVLYGVTAIYALFALHLITVFSTLASAFSGASLVH